MHSSLYKEQQNSQNRTFEWPWYSWSSSGLAAKHQIGSLLPLLEMKPAHYKKKALCLSKSTQGELRHSADFWLLVISIYGLWILSQLTIFLTPNKWHICKEGHAGNKKRQHRSLLVFSEPPGLPSAGYWSGCFHTALGWCQGRSYGFLCNVWK
jgi:hypothetical protein